MDNDFNAPRNTNAGNGMIGNEAQKAPTPPVEPPKTENTRVTTVDEEVVKLRESNKHLKIWVTVFLVLLVAGIVGIFVFWQQNQQKQEELASQEEQISQLQKETAVSKQAEYEATIAEQNQTITDQQTKITELEAEIARLENEHDATQSTTEDTPSSTTETENSTTTQ